MNQEVMDAIKKVLPSIQIETLNEELARAKQLQPALEKIKSFETMIVTKNDEISKHQAEVRRLEGLVRTQAELDKIRNDFEIEKLKYQLQAEKEKHQAVKDLVSSVFRNPTFVKHTAVPVAGSQNSNGYTVPVTETTTHE